MTKTELDRVLELHAKWLEGAREGKRAHLSGAHLSGAHLRGADLSDADLRGADLSGAKWGVPLEDLHGRRRGPGVAQGPGVRH